MQSPGMHGHFQVLAADERFGALRIGLYRNVSAVLPAYEIVIDLEEQSLDVLAELAEFASERELQSRVESTGEVVLFEATDVL